MRFSGWCLLTISVLLPTALAASSWSRFQETGGRFTVFLEDGDYPSAVRLNTQATVGDKYFVSAYIVTPAKDRSSSHFSSCETWKFVGTFGGSIVQIREDSLKEIKPQNFLYSIISDGFAKPKNI